MHALIIGPRHVGKSTLITRVLDSLSCPVTGYETQKEDSLRDENLGSPIYIYEARKPRYQTGENLVGYCKNHVFDSHLEAFDRFAPQLLSPVPEGGVILLDEIGFMEAKAETFSAAIMELLDGDTPVIAAVKDAGGFPFLDDVRSHPKAKCFYITEENRGRLYAEVLEYMQKQLHRR